MQYISTRGGQAVNAAEAIVKGICPAGGLYVPADFPSLDINELLPIAGDYHRIAQKVMGPFLSLTPADELDDMIQKAYGPRFDTEKIAPVLARMTLGLYRSVFFSQTEYRSASL